VLAHGSAQLLGVESGRADVVTGLDLWALLALSSERKWYAIQIARPVERESGFAEHPNKLLNPARFARWTPNCYALGRRLAYTLGVHKCVSF